MNPSVKLTVRQWAYIMNHLISNPIKEEFEILAENTKSAIQPGPILGRIENQVLDTIEGTKQYKIYKNIRTSNNKVVTIHGLTWLSKPIFPYGKR